MNKVDLMKELLDRYEQLKTTEMSSGVRLVVQSYVKKLEFSLIKALKEEHRL